jgi:hypothetical protein
LEPAQNKGKLARAKVLG